MAAAPKTTTSISISTAEYERLLSLVEQQKAEIKALEYRIKTLLRH